WEARTKSGLTYELGKTAASRLDNSLGTFKWLLERAVDTNGNEIQYRYLQDTDNGQAYIQEIAYNFTGDNYQSVNFFYDDTRPDKLTDYHSGAAVLTALRLDRVEVASWLGGVRTLVR